MKIDFMPAPSAVSLLRGFASLGSSAKPSTQYRISRRPGERCKIVLITAAAQSGIGRSGGVDGLGSPEYMRAALRGATAAEPPFRSGRSRVAATTG
jgi:hypothetical protein